MRIINHFSIAALVGVLVLTLLSESAVAQFHDQGLVNAVVRTDYNSQTEGTSSNPITYVNPCLFSSPTWCGNSPTTFSASNSFSQNSAGYPQSNFWVLDFNNEPSYNRGGQTTNNPGPPNQSIPRSSPGFGLMGFTTLKDLEAGENYFRAHMVMNGTFPNPTFDAAPYIAIGTERYRGNVVAPGFLNSFDANKRVQFKAKLWEFKLPKKIVSATQPTQEPSIAFYVYAITRWGGKDRGLFITLAHWNLDNSDSTTFTKNWQWNWPMQESFYHNGIEWVFIDAEDVQAHCGFSVPRLTTKNQQISYDLNWQNLFQCLGSASKFGWDTVFPTGQVLTIEGVHWSVEMTGEDGWIWPSVHDMKMVQ